MKTIVKIEIAILVVVVLVAAGMILLSEGFLDWFRDPVVIEQNPTPVATDAPTESSQPEETEAVEPQEEEPTQPQAEDTPEPTEPRVITAAKYFAYPSTKRSSCNSFKGSSIVPYSL